MSKESRSRGAAVVKNVLIWRSRRERRTLWRKSRNPLMRASGQSRTEFSSAWRESWKRGYLLPLGHEKLRPIRSDGKLRVKEIEVIAPARRVQSSEAKEI